MTIRLAVAADRPQLRALFLASGYASLYSDLRLSDFVGPNTRTIVNDNAGTINGCVVADRDDTSSQKIIHYRMGFGASGATGLLAIRNLLKDIVPTMKALGYTRWYATVPQGPAFATFRAYLEARWPYLHDDPTQPNYDGGQEWRIMGDTLDRVLVAA